MVMSNAGGTVIMKQYQVGIVGATGMVGQRFSLLLENHPWFHVAALAASGRNRGKTYAEAVEGRWKMAKPIPESMKNLVLLDATEDAETLASQVDFIFCAVDMKKDEIRALEERYAKLECPVISNNSANRLTPDVPMIIPEVNADHAKIIHAQKKRLGTKRGFIAVKSNCSIQSYVPALSAIWELGIEEVAVCTYQAISGAGNLILGRKWLIDVIPYIGGEEEKSEVEPMKVWGHIEGDVICSRRLSKNHCTMPACSGCRRTHGSRFCKTQAQIQQGGNHCKVESLFRTRTGAGTSPAPQHFLTYFEEENRPQTKLDRDLEHGMGVSVGRLREDTVFDYKFVSLSHNTLRGAAGGAVLMAELLCAEGYMDELEE